MINTVPKIKLLPGERRLERATAREEEARYLGFAREPLASVATVLADTGPGPEECFRLRWETMGGMVTAPIAQLDRASAL